MISGEEPEFLDQKKLGVKSSISQHHISIPEINGSPPPPYTSDSDHIVPNGLKTKPAQSSKPVTSPPSPDANSASDSTASCARTVSDGPSALPRLSPDHLLEQSRLLDKVEVESCSSGIKDSQLGQPAIRVPPNSLLWLKLVRSRFLLIQSCEMVLELWDLTTPAKCVGSCGVDGTVDGAVIEDEGDPYSTGIFVSTRSYTVYSLRFGHPGFGEPQAAGPWLTSSVLFRGLSEIVDARGSLFASLHSEVRGLGAFLKNHQNGAVVELVRSLDPITDLSWPNHESQTSRPLIAHNGIIDIQILSNIIVVARNCSFNLYSLSEVIHKLADGGGSAGISAIKASRSIDYPDLKLPVYRGSLIRQPNPRLGIDPGAFALFSTEPSGCYAIISQPGWISEAASAVTQSQVRSQVTEPLFRMALGASARRLAVLSDTYLTVYFTSRPDLDKAAGCQGSGGLMACWTIPEDFRDIPVALDFDEATGRCVAAMASGRIWVKETANFLSEIPTSSRVTKILDFDLPEIPNPDPARWPVVMPFPAPFGIQPLSDPPKQVAPRWSNEVDKYFPYKNRPDCYGSTPWVVHEALHIPVVWPGHQPTPFGKYGARTVLFTVAEVRNEPFYDEVIEVRPLPGSDEGNRFWLLCMDSGDWEFYRLKPIGSLDDIVAHLQHGGVGALREHDEPWPADEVKLDQLSRWMDKYESGFGKFERDNRTY